MDARRPDVLTDDAVAARLRSSGQRVTRQRLAIHRALAALGGHRGVDEVAAWLTDNDQPLPATSIYNALKALETAALVTVASPGPPRARYEAAGGAHHHFVCRRCGAIIDVDAPPGDRRLVRRPVVPGAVVEDVELTYRGLCPTCVRTPS